TGGRGKASLSTMVPCIKTVVTLLTKESSPSCLAFPAIRNWPLLLLIWEKRPGYRCVDCTALPRSTRFGCPSTCSPANEFRSCLARFGGMAREKPIGDWEKYSLKRYGGLAEKPFSSPAADSRIRSTFRSHPNMWSL